MMCVTSWFATGKRVLRAGGWVCFSAMLVMASGPMRAQQRSAMPAAGRTFYVSPAGSDRADGRTPATAFHSLQRAADATGPGDTVDVMSGTYTNETGAAELLTIARAGTPEAWITYQAYPGNRPGNVPVLRGDEHTWDVVQFKNTAAFVTLSGFTVIGNDANVTLAEAQAKEKEPAQHPETNGNCITVEGRGKPGEGTPHHLRILKNIASKCPGGGIAVMDADDVTIAGNTVYDNSWYGAFGTSGISVLGGVDTDPADTAKKYRMVVEGNVVYGNQEFIPWAAYKPPTITDGEGIIIDSNKNSAYAAGGSKHAPYAGRTLVANNVVYRNGSAAIEVFQSAHVDVVNNSTYADVITPVEKGRGELNLNVASDVRAVNNVFVSAPGQMPVVMGSACTGGCVLDYNVYFGGKNSLIGMREGAHDLTGDPLYVAPREDAPAAVSLKLSAGSVAIGSGTAEMAPARDIEGKARPGAGVDRGAYQH